MIPELQIIDEATFERVNAVRQQRANTYEGQRSAPRKVTGRALLSGIVYCGHCGGRIFATTARKTHYAIAAGTVSERIAIYKCYNRTQHKDLCDGPTTYRADKVDAAVEEILNKVFLGVGKENESELVEQQYKTKKDEYTVKLKRAKTDHAKASKELARLDSMMMDAIDGNCIFSPQDLQRRMQTVKDSVSELQAAIDSTERAMEESGILLRRIKDEYRQLETWAQVFHEASPDVKKMIASYMIERVTVGRDYEVNVDLNITEAQFFGGMKMEL